MNSATRYITCEAKDLETRLAAIGLRTKGEAKQAIYRAKRLEPRGSKPPPKRIYGLTILIEDLGEPE